MKHSTWNTCSMAIQPLPSPTTFSPQRAQRPEREGGQEVKILLIEKKNMYGSNVAEHGLHQNSPLKEGGSCHKPTSW